MEQQDRERLPEWIDDARAEARWRDVRTVMARMGQVESLGKTRDLSLGGLGVAIQGMRPAPGDVIHLDVVFEGGVQEIRGRVVHSQPKAWGSLVGVRREGEDAAVEAFLARRYGSDPAPLGRVT